MEIARIISCELDSTLRPTFARIWYHSGSKAGIDITSEQKQENQKKARKRIVVERLIRLVKNFRVAAERFRWKRENYEPVILV
jgi:hypothetical protein